MQLKNIGLVTWPQKGAKITLPRGPGMASSHTAFYTQSAFYPWSAVCSPQSAFYTDRIANDKYGNRSRGWRLYDEMRPLVEATDICFVDPKLLEWQCALAWVFYFDRCFYVNLFWSLVTFAAIWLLMHHNQYSTGHITLGYFLVCFFGLRL